MKKRDGNRTAATAGEPAAPGSAVDGVEQKVLAFAEQLGRVVGTVQAKAEGWLDRESLNAQVASVRDSAADLLEQLGGGKPGDGASGTEGDTGAKSGNDGRTRRKTAGAAMKASANSRANNGRSGGVVDAPGKRHRKPAPSQPAPKGNDSRVARMKLANASRSRGRG